MSESSPLDHTLWRSVAPTLLVWTELDGDYVVYHRVSGTTHFVNHGSKQLLNALQTQSMTTAALVDLFAEIDDDARREDVVGAVAATLDQFEEHGLLERCDER